MPSTSTLVLCALLCLAAGAPEWPKNLDKCKIDDSECLKKVAQFYLSNYATVKGLFRQHVDPLEIIKLVISKRENSPVSINLTLFNMILRNIQHSVIDNIRVPPGTTSIELESHLDLDITGQYEVDGSVLVLPVTGKGDCHFLMYGTQVKLHFDFDEIEKNGKKYWNIKKADLKLSFKKATLQLDNLFNGDKALGDNMNKVINDNWETIVGEIKEPLEQGIGAALEQVMSGMFSRYPISDLFLQ